jgi:cysteine desulfurase
VFLNGHLQQRACHILNVSIAGVEAESLLLALGDLAVSSGSACSAESAEPSAVLRQLGRSGELARSSLRFSLARTNTAAEMTAAAAALNGAIEHLRRLSPAGVA